MRNVFRYSLVALLAACAPSNQAGGPDGGADGGPLRVPWLEAPTTMATGGTLGYYRFPTIRGDVVVFAAEGDLWQVSRSGGVASRLTSHPANESNPAISADGLTIAFSAAYEGPTEVYTMPRAGGTPVRRTFDGDSANVVGFAPDGALVYATRRYSTLPETQLVRLDLNTGERSLLPLAQASEGAWTTDGKTLFFTRRPFQGSHTKRYQGGTAQNVWKYVQGEPEALPMTGDYAGTSKTPMYWNGRVYFLTDRDGTMNIWSMDENGHDLRQHTQHKGWDAAQAALADGRIVYKLGADLRIFEIANGMDTALDVRIVSDFDQQRETWVEKPLEYLTSVALSPKGDRVVLTARGQVFVAPVKQGRFVEVTRKPGVRYRHATFMPDGNKLLVLSDESGEVEVWQLPANGIGDPEQITKDATILRWDAVPSPDGKWIAHHDKKNQLWVRNIDKRADKLIFTAKNGTLQDLSWSPDGRWLAFVAQASNSFTQIYLYDVEDEKTTTVTTDRFDSWSATWSPDGEWLYFLSDRNLKNSVPSTWGARQPDPYIANPTEIYAVALKKDGRFPFLPDDELQKDDSKDNRGKKDAVVTKGADKGGAKTDANRRNVEIDLEGLPERLYKVPIPPGRFEGLRTDGSRLYWIARDVTASEPKRQLQALVIGHDKPHVKTMMDDVREYQVSEDDKKLLVRKGKERAKESELYVFDVGDKAPDKLDEFKVDLGSWTFSFHPREQWQQMFVDAWRLERDYFYDPGMHGLDWVKVRDKYAPLVDRVRTRYELSDILAQMVSELSALHIFVSGGDTRRGPDEIDVGALGAEFTKDTAAGGFRVGHIYTTDPDFPQMLSPLRRNGAAIQEGDVIESINGTPTPSVTDMGTLLRNKASRQVLLHVKPKKGDARDVIVTPMRTQEATNLRYDDWEFERRKRVEEQSKGTMGYVHLRGLGGANYTEWARDYYPVHRRQGLIVDLRHNTGGNIDSWILGKLLRKPWMYWQSRTDEPYWNMQYAFRGHMVVLVDAWTGSDGEAFAEGFRRLGLGKVIGTRTWGGEIWLSAENVLLDSGIATAAEYGVYGPEGQWLIEGHGVDPDMVVDNLPRATFEGKDAQLDAAIRYLEEKIRTEPIKDIAPPAFPKKGQL